MISVKREVDCLVLLVVRIYRRHEKGSKSSLFDFDDLVVA